MERLEIGSIVKVVKTGRIGEVISLEGSNVIVAF